MPRIKSKTSVWAFAASLGLWVILGQGQNAEAYSSYRGLWEARENDDGKIIQRYDHQLSFDTEQSLSDRLTSKENVIYDRQWEDESGAREMVSPGASLTIASDLFLADLSANSIKILRSEVPTGDTDTVGSTWESRWKKAFVPDVRFNLDYSRTKIDANASSNADSSNYEGRKDVGGEITWDLRLFKAFYHYQNEKTELTGNQITQDSQFARVNSTRAWFNNSLHVNLGYEYSENKYENQISFTNGSTANISVDQFMVAYTGIEASPANLIFPDPLVPNPALRDNNLTSLAYTVPVDADPSHNYCIRLLQNNPLVLSVDRIYLYTQDNLETYPAGLQLRLYSNDDFNLAPWNEVLGITASYDAVKQRFVIVVPAVKKRYLKLVVRNLFGQTLNITEIKAEQIQQGSIGSTVTTLTKTTSDKVNFNLDYKFNELFGIYYTYLKVSDEADGTPSNVGENHNFGTHLQNAAGDLRSTFSYSLSKHRYLEGPETEMQTYLVDFSKTLLPTLTVSLGGSHVATSQDGNAVSDLNRYTFYTDALLYPDLTSRLEVTYWEQETYRPGLPNGLWGDLRSQLMLTSRFRPSLVVSFLEVYEVLDQDNLNTTKKNSVSLIGSWQLSELFSLNGSIQKDDSNVTNNSYLYTLGMLVGLGVGLEWKTSYTRQVSEDVNQSGSTSLRWTAHPNVSWEVGCDYAESSSEAIQVAYKVYSRVLVNFATQ